MLVGGREIIPSAHDPEIFQSFKFFMESVAVHLRQLMPVFLFFSFLLLFFLSFLFWKRALNLDQQRAEPHLNSISRPQVSLLWSERWKPSGRGGCEAERGSLHGLSTSSRVYHLLALGSLTVGSLCPTTVSTNTAGKSKAVGEPSICFLSQELPNQSSPVITWGLRIALNKAEVCEHHRPPEAFFLKVTKQEVLSH